MSRPLSNAYVLGVGMTEFIKPRRVREYPELGFEAGVKAMLDAQITYDEVQFGVGCFCYGGTCSAQRVFYQFGMTGIPILNTNNACATGSTGLHIARTMVRNGAADVILVVGFEQMAPGAIKDPFEGLPSPMEFSRKMMEETRGRHDSPHTAQYFANAGRAYMEKYGARAEDFAEIARISHEHSTRNPYAQFQKAYTLEEILSSTMIHAPLTKLQCSPTSDGAGAAVIVSEAYLAKKPWLKSQAILMAGQSMMTDTPTTYSRDAIDLVGYDMTARAVDVALREAGTSSKEVGVCELHDCFSTNEMILLDGLGFSDKGKAHLMVRNGDITHGGKGPLINPSGGLISKGHPLGATGLAQCCELTWQLRGWANNRLAPPTKIALQHNLGLGGCVVINVYRRADGKGSAQMTDKEIASSTNWTYNPATSARVVSPEDVAKVVSRKAKVEYVQGDTLEKIQSRL
ncbi:hypothetical protein DOTSEDRAFT_53046 [Dothistroma septosporum NZE10]|uniref:propanoyl-CoA C-acyltransferase n=1 Tax=Dothistroma septosporum (strain NZE10 / CBS 128990) TaxID=675120 RepID=N1PJQ1_DOTSN|nr:hypothetical protein DOTSEDRAFT_53046 [Dothistroma septosporum NZE10]